MSKFKPLRTAVVLAPPETVNFFKLTLAEISCPALKDIPIWDMEVDLLV